MRLGNKSISFFYKSKWLKNVDEFDVNSIRQNNLMLYSIGLLTKLQCTKTISRSPNFGTSPPS